MLYSMRNLKKIYNGRTVLDLPELGIEAGKIYGLLGPNGSGKTTLLSILGFLKLPTSGTLFFRDKPVSFSEKALHALRQQVIVVDQHPIMFSAPVFHNVAFGLKVRKTPKNIQKKIVEECLDRVGMRDFTDAPATGLSGGETQRVAIARALACSPEVLLFDEPTASVDVSNQLIIENIINDLHADKKISILISTHNLLQAARLTHENIYLFEGRAGKFIYENIFSGTAFSKNEQAFCRVKNGIAVPLKKTETGTIRIAINPKSLEILHSGDEPGLLPGSVVQLNREQDWVRVMVDTGVPLSVMIRQKEYRRLNLCVGDKVLVRCPDYGVEVI